MLNSGSGSSISCHDKATSGQPLQDCVSVVSGSEKTRRRWGRRKKMRLRCFRCWQLGVPPTWLVVLGAILVQIGFGLYPVAVKKFAVAANPLVFNFYRSVFCFPLLFLCALIVERRIMFPDCSMLLVFVALGLTGMFGNQLLYILGVYWVGPTVASAMQPIIPVWTTILAILTCTEKRPSPFHVHTWVKLIGILLATGGAVALALPSFDSSKLSDTDKNPLINTDSSNFFTDYSSNNSTSEQQKIFGCFSLLGNTLCMATYVLIQKRFIFNRQDCNWKHHPIYVTAYGYFFGALFMGLSNVYYIAKGQVSVFKIPQNSIYALLYAIFITSAICYMLITWSNLHLSATIVTAFWPTQVLVSATGSYFAVGETLVPLQYIGAVMVIVALFMVLFSNHMEGRLRDGKSVLRLDCHMKGPSPFRQERDLDRRIASDETQPLLHEKQATIQ